MRAGQAGVQQCSHLRAYALHKTCFTVQGCTQYEQQKKNMIESHSCNAVRVVDVVCGMKFICKRTCHSSSRGWIFRFTFAPSYGMELYCYECLQTQENKPDISITHFRNTFASAVSIRAGRPQQCRICSAMKHDVMIVYEGEKKTHIQIYISALSVHSDLPHRALPCGPISIKDAVMRAVSRTGCWRHEYTMLYSVTGNASSCHTHTPHIVVMRCRRAGKPRVSKKRLRASKAGETFRFSIHHHFVLFPLHALGAHDSRPFAETHRGICAMPGRFARIVDMTTCLEAKTSPLHRRKRGSLRLLLLDLHMFLFFSSLVLHVALEVYTATRLHEETSILRRLHLSSGNRASQ